LKSAHPEVCNRSRTEYFVPPFGTHFLKQPVVIPSWSQFGFVRIAHKFLNLVTFSSELFPLHALRLFLHYVSLRDPVINLHSVSSTFTPRPIPLLAANSFCYHLQSTKGTLFIPLAVVKLKGRAFYSFKTMLIFNFTSCNYMSVSGGCKHASPQLQQLWHSLYRPIINVSVRQFCYIRAGTSFVLRLSLWDLW